MKIKSRNVVKKKLNNVIKIKKREFKICRCRILFDEKIEHVKKYETWIKKAKNVLLLCKVLLICYFTQ